MTDRLAMARQILMQAETAVGLERTRPFLHDQVSHGRTASCGMAEVEAGASWKMPGVSRRDAWSDQTGWSVPDGLHSVFPSGLRRGSAVGVRGSRLAGLLMVGLASSQGAWVACIGTPNMGWGMARLLGVDFERLVFVPQCMDPLLAQAVSTAIDGFDVVLVGRQVILGSREKRLLARRALSRQVLLIGEGWEGGEQVQGQLIAVEGVGQGNGHIRELLLDVFRPGGKPARVAIDARGWSVREKLQLVPVSGMPKTVESESEVLRKLVAKNEVQVMLRSPEDQVVSQVLPGIPEPLPIQITPGTPNDAAPVRALEMVPLQG